MYLTRPANFFKKILFLFLVQFFICGLPSSLKAEDSISFGDVQISTPSHKAGKLDHRWGIYNFSVGWQGLNAAKAWVSIRPHGKFIEVRSVAKTNSFIDIFYKLRFQSYAVVDAETYRPKRVQLDHQENSRRKKIEVNFPSKTLVTSTQERNDRPRENYSFDPKNDMLDPFSAMILARSLEWKLGQSRDFDIFTGKSRYLVNLTVTGEKEINVLGKPRNCWVVEPKVKKLNERKPDGKLRSARIYVSKDKFREILLLESEVFIGTVKAKFLGFDPFDAKELQKAPEQPPAGP